MAKRKNTSELMQEIKENTEMLREAWEVPVAQETPETYNTVRLVNNISARVHMKGSISGKHYEWSRAGAIVEVDERDAPDLLTKRLGDKACCGSANKNEIFAIVE